MCRLKLLLIFVGAVLTLGSSVASAQSTITLAATSDGTITFTSDASDNLTMTFGVCTGGSNCVKGTATGTGVFSSGSGSYLISLSGSLTFTNVGAGKWNVTSGGPLTFSWKDASNTTLLSGNLNLVNLAQSGSSGIFNTNFVANLTSLSGSFAGLFTSAGGIANITIQIKTGDLTVASSTSTANLDHGSIGQTPEPSTIGLLGSGLVVLGGFLRRRWRLSHN